MTGDKSELRAGLRAHRSARSKEGGAPERTSASLLGAMLAGDLLPRLGQGSGQGADEPPVVAAYLATAHEPDVAAICAWVSAQGGRVLLPVPVPPRTLAWAIDSGRYERDPRLPVRVPVGRPVGRGAAALLARGARLLLVPALAVDRSGTRLGQGGGYYDVLLADLAEHERGSGAERLVVAAVVHDDEVLAAGSLPREEFDVTVSLALTPSGVVALG